MTIQIKSFLKENIMDVDLSEIKRRHKERSKAYDNLNSEYTFFPEKHPEKHWIEISPGVFKTNNRIKFDSIAKNSKTLILKMEFIL